MIRAIEDLFQLVFNFTTFSSVPRHRRASKDKNMALLFKILSEEGIRQFSDGLQVQIRFEGA